MKPLTATGGMMPNYLVQSNYLREVQRSFGSSGNFDFLGLLTQLMYMALPVIVVWLIWRFRHVLLFTFGRSLVRLLRLKSHNAIENYLVARGVPVEICHYADGRIGSKICNGRIESVHKGRMKMQLVNVQPTALNLKNARVICLTKPFSYSGKRKNAFVTLVSRARKKGIMLKELTLFTPIRYKFAIRRRHARQRVAREGAVRVKAWSGRKANSFWVVRPVMQTVNNPARYSDRTRLAVENISAGGMRMFVINPRGALPPLQPGNQLVLRVSVWNPKNRKYAFFTAIGTIRSRFSGKGGAIGLGIQFTAEGEPVGSRYAWKSLHGEIPSLAQFLKQIEE